MIYHKFNIDFAAIEVKRNKISFPFNIVLQTNNNEIEVYCIKTWPRLMDPMTMYTVDDKKDQYRMEKYIGRNLNNQTKDLNDIHKFFYDRRWLAPLGASARMTEIELFDYNCKTWTNPEIPFLEVKGRVILDLPKLINYYFKKNYLKFKRIDRFIKERIIIRFHRPLPILMTYMTGVTVKNEVLKYIEKEGKRKGSFINKKFQKLTKLKNFHKLKKEISWKSDKEIEIEINDMFRLLSIKARKNYLPLTAAGFIAYKVIKKHRQRQIGRR